VVTSTTKQVAGDPNTEQEQQREHVQPTTLDATKPQDRTTPPNLLKIQHHQECKVNNSTKVAKHPTNTTKAANHPPKTILDQRDDSGKASA
jgi:hypothetical protein